MRRARGVAAVAVLGAATLASAALASAASARTVSVQLMEMMVMPSVATVPAGKVNFVVKNAGKLKHDFVVLKTNRPPAKLMVMGSKAMESGRIARLPALGPGQTRRLTLTLTAGKYVLLCNVAGHYAAGMRTAFAVR